MNKSEVFELMIEIKKNYAAFDVSGEEVERHFKHLKDFPIAAAMKNVDAYVKTNQYPPKIADIRGRLGEQMAGELSKQLAAQYEANLTLWSSENSEPPEGYWQSIRDRLRGEHHV